MKNLMTIMALFFAMTTPLYTYAQENEEPQKLIEALTYEKQPGFANASSKIFTSERKFTISGFGEVNYVNFQGSKDKSSEDMELFYSNLFRTGIWLGYKFTDRIILVGELQTEYLTDQFQQGEFAFAYELVLDFLINNNFNLRFGNYPMGIGWVNQNDEPIGFKSVNRPEVERLIIPTAWMEFGLLAYGYALPKLEYAFGVTNGFNGPNFSSGTWIRNGRNHNMFERPSSYAFNGKLQYGDEDDFLIGVSGYYGDASKGYTFSTEDHNPYAGEKLNSNLGMLSAHGIYKVGNLELFGLMAKGWLSGTEQLFQIHQEILGAETFGYYAQAAYDILPFFNQNTEWKLPLFVRYERLNTHQKIHQDLQGLDYPFAKNDLEVVTVGFNAQPKKSIVLKANYQIRKNFAGIEEPNQVELGVGFIF
ncbi:hypothetical protein [Persicobacter psychrovividus]